MPNQLFRTQEYKDNPNLSYYGSLNKNTGTSNLLGNGNNPVYNKSTQVVNYNPTSGWTLADGRQVNNTNMWGSAGANIDSTKDPRYYIGSVNAGDESGITNWTRSDSTNTRLGDRIQLGQLGVGGYGEVMDPSLVEWDDEFGLLTPNSNVREPGGSGWNNRMGAAIMAAFGGAMAFPALSGAGAVTDAGLLPAMTAPEVGGALSVAPEVVGGAGASAGAGAGLGASAAPLIDVPAALPAYTAPEVTGSLSSIPNISSGASTFSNFLNSPLARIAGGLASSYLSNQQQSGYNSAANRADPFGNYRGDYAQRLNQLYSDPSYIQNLPGYQFKQQQGEQAINRAAAKSGHFRSPNMLFDLSKFNSGLAETYYNQELQNLMALSGANVNPSTAAQIQANGIQQSTNMRAGALNSALGAVGSFANWYNNPNSGSFTNWLTGA